MSSAQTWGCAAMNLRSRAAGGFVVEIGEPHTLRLEDGQGAPSVVGRRVADRQRDRNPTLGKAGACVHEGGLVWAHRWRFESAREQLAEVQHGGDVGGSRRPAGKPPADPPTSESLECPRRPSSTSASAPAISPPPERGKPLLAREERVAPPGRRLDARPAPWGAGGRGGGRRRGRVAAARLNRAAACSALEIDRLFPQHALAATPSPHRTASRPRHSLRLGLQPPFLRPVLRT